MSRAVNTPASRKRRKRILKKAEGFWGARHKCVRVAREAVAKAEEYSTRDRRNRKRDMRRLWITRLNAACREEGTTYSVFMSGLKKAGIGLNRKMLSELAIHDGNSFKKLVELSRGA